MADIDRNNPTHIIGTDGGLRTVPAYLVDGLVKQGWKVIINPKRTYYPELDVKHPAYSKKQDVPDNADVLEGEVV